MKLGRSFFNLYFFIISTFIIFSWALDEVWNSYLEQDIESYTGYKTLMMATGDYVQKHPKEEWEEIIAGAAKRWELPLKLVSLAEVEAIDHTDHNALPHSNAHIYYFDDQVIIHYLLKDSESVITLGPAKMPTRPRVKATYRVMILATFGIVIFIWLWPMSRDLELLKRATRDFGQGQFDSKAPAAKSTMIAPMIASFNMMAARIKRLIEAHKELTNAVSHELRTPLARTKFALQMLDSIKDDEKRAKYQKQISNDVCELEELINEMLIYAAFDNDKPELNFTSTNLNDLVKFQIASHDQFVNSIELVNTMPDSYVCCDGHFIDRAVNNFISNAIKYGNDKVRVTLAIENDQCIICVEDNGDGVSDEFKQVIFDAFSRGDQSRNRETGGFGLGLAIVARIMEWHQGHASIGDSELGGAAFTLTWPVKMS
ncbi:ATP-binding protein [Colwellia psychrerythraea]|uniref:histidine kinase n=1 Tax=Colwellia psychrerythraea TaxID=28229 RepID=A0A099KAV3_COLPS|nr:ATP-binding protein [Colwellia psychrerythraea]KGJ86723.1 integral membrane sensor signal transduction histidine kinase [Colwellia psychrerythraea]